MKAYIQTTETSYTIDDVDRLFVNGPLVEIQRMRPERSEGGQFETIAVVDASILATVTLGVEPQPSAAGLPSEPAAETGNGHRPTRRYGHIVRRDLRERAYEPW
ncbi:MAG TPA: hypothetical protein VHK65_06575 [Candidatus Dormibacteraeota bacterium]|nr:hypothetical protein [Candidatus Dormibacteraeota bacterium]